MTEDKCVKQKLKEYIVFASELSLSWLCDHIVGKVSAISQPTWPAQPTIPPGLVNK